ncbi:MAG: ABC transporter [Spirochaetes bacterium]|jgi:ABC-2 type transport system permease protein|nr:ABC transporter [Spirochaetota bacterium]
MDRIKILAEKAADRAGEIYRARLREAVIIMKKEFRSYFYTPIAYIVTTIFLVFTGFFFFKDFFYYNQSEMRNFFQLLPLMFTFVIPAVTMKLFSEEMHSGSIEILMTLPVTVLDVAVGKLLAATAFVGVMISPSLFYLATMIIAGSPDPGPVIGGYIGALFLGGAYASVGILASSFSRNQIISFITGWAACFFLWLIDKVVVFLPAGLGFVQYFGTDYHFQNIARGILDSRDIIYFLTIIAVSMLATSRVIEERR